jgi:hypothetical protein
VRTLIKRIWPFDPSSDSYRTYSGRSGFTLICFESTIKYCFDIVFCHFLLAQKVTKKGTTKTNRLLVFVAPPAPGPAELAVRTFRGQAARRQLLLLPFDETLLNSSFAQGKLLLQLVLVLELFPNDQ